MKNSVYGLLAGGVVHVAVDAERDGDRATDEEHADQASRVEPPVRAGVATAAAIGAPSARDRTVTAMLLAAPGPQVTELVRVRIRTRTTRAGRPCSSSAWRSSCSAACSPRSCSCGGVGRRSTLQEVRSMADDRRLERWLESARGRGRRRDPRRVGARRTARHHRAAEPAGAPFRRFGDGSAICFPVAALYGEEYIELGEGCIVGPYCTLSAGVMPGHVLDHVPVVTIGDRCSSARGAGSSGTTRSRSATTCSPATTSTSPTPTTATRTSRCRSASSSRRPARCASAAARGSGTARSCCPAPTSGARRGRRGLGGHRRAARLQRRRRQPGAGDPPLRRGRRLGARRARRRPRVDRRRGIGAGIRLRATGSSAAASAGGSVSSTVVDVVGSNSPTCVVGHCPGR